MKQSSEPLAKGASTEAAGDEWANQARPLRECGEMAATRLAAAFSDALKHAADQLFAKGAQGPASHEQRMWLDAADFTRSRRQDMVDAFRKHFQHRYALACRRRPPLATSQVLDFDISQLKIVEHDMLDNALDPADLIDAIRNGTWSSLHELTKWFRDVQDKPDLLPNEMPLGPKLIGGAVTDAVNDQFWGYDAKHHLIRALGRCLPEPVNRIYLDLTAYLARMEESAAPLEDGASRFAEPPRMASEARTTDGADAQAAAPAAVPPIGGAAAAESGQDSAALAAADAAIAAWLADTHLPGFIREFIAGPWHDLLVRIHGDGGGPEWDAALAILDDLAQSLRPPADAAQRARRMQALPELVRRLARGLATLDPDPAFQEPFFARLADCHIRLLSAPRAAPDLPPVYVPVDVPLESLEVGTMLEMGEADDARRELKLSWISPRRKLFVLTDQQGQRALSLNAKDLAARLRDGKARILHVPDDASAGKGLAQSPNDKKSA